jgi:HSP20 family molecular chaperone IbpA
MKTVSKLLAVSTLSAGLMTTGQAMIETNDMPNRFSELDSFMQEFDRCWQEDMREFYSDFVGVTKAPQAKVKKESIDYRKFAVQEVGKNDKAVYGVRITLPGVEPRSIKLNVRNDNGCKKLTLTADLVSATPTPAAEPDKAVAPTAEAPKAASVKQEVQQKAAEKCDEQAPVVKDELAKDVAQPAAKSYASQQMYTYKMVNGRARELTLQDGHITVTMDLPSNIDIKSAQKPSLVNDVISIDFTKESSTEEQTFSFGEDKDDK